MLESDILFYALENFKGLTELKVRLKRPPKKSIDAAILIGNPPTLFLVEVKNEIHRSNIPDVLKKIKDFKDNPLLVAKSISKETKEVLKSRHINYLDMDGNCFITNESGLFIQIDGKKGTHFLKKKKNLVFNKNGIKLIFALLVIPELINQPYRVMAEAAKISLSTVGNLLEDLNEKGFLVKVNPKKRTLTNKKDLLSKWVNAYNEKLKPSLLRGTFNFAPTALSQWKKLKLDTNTYWGGEPAANILTSFLSPEFWVLYSNSEKKDLLKNLKLIPTAQKNKVAVYSIFWNLKSRQFIDEKKHIVHHLLIYADLIGTMDNRNLETAQRIYEKFLLPYLSE